MSNHLAIATVTAALGQIAHAAAQSAVAGVGLHFGRPTPPTSDLERRKIHVYLYQVTPNAALRNSDLPTRKSNGKLARRPQAALDLHYLLTFYGDDQTLEPDRMLGAVERDLHARPVLSAQAIQDAIDAVNTALGNVDREKREAQLTLQAKNDATALLSAGYQGIADAATGLYVLAGRPDHADQIRPTARRRAGLPEPEDLPPDDTTSTTGSTSTTSATGAIGTA